MSRGGYLRSRFRSILIALGGIRQVILSQENAKIHALITLLVILMGLLLTLSRGEWISLILVIGLVWTAEIFNTAVEVLVDMISPGHNVAAKTIKDISAGAVLFSAMISVVVGMLILGPHLWDLGTSVFGN
jgi:diacylglycerol kinase